MKYSISTEITIKATPSVVWSVLTDTEQYPSWNPFISKLEGDLRKGGRLKAVIGGMKFKPVVLTCRKNEELKWIGRLLFAGIFDGEHRFVIEDNGDGTCRFIQSEKFNGILVYLFKKKLDTDTVVGFRAMNEALKVRCEGALASSFRD